MEKTILTKSQEIKLEKRKIKYYGKDCYIYPIIKYDDECNNGHNTFSITCDIRNLNGQKVNKGSVSFKKLKLKETNKTYLIERCTVDTRDDLAPL